MAKPAISQYSPYRRREFLSKAEPEFPKSQHAKPKYAEYAGPKYTKSEPAEHKLSGTAGNGQAAG